jgi:hypothetical protein
MRYAMLEESVLLIERRASPAQTLQLSRRVRHLAVASDRDGDVAAAMFLRRGVNGEPWVDVHSLEWQPSGWRLLGGGSGNGGDNLLTVRPPLTQLGTPGVNFGGGGSLRNPERPMPWGARWLRWAELRLVEEVATLLVGDRHLPVAAHGIALVVWQSRHRPPVVALDEAGRELGSLDVRDH